MWASLRARLHAGRIALGSARGLGGRSHWRELEEGSGKAEVGTTLQSWPLTRERVQTDRARANVIGKRREPLDERAGCRDPTPSWDVDGLHAGIGYPVTRFPFPTARPMSKPALSRIASCSKRMLDFIGPSDPADGVQGTAMVSRR